MVTTRRAAKATGTEIPEIKSPQPDRKPPKRKTPAPDKKRPEEKKKPAEKKKTAEKKGGKRKRGEQENEQEAGVRPAKGARLVNHRPSDAYLTVLKNWNRHETDDPDVLFTISLFCIAFIIFKIDVR